MASQGPPRCGSARFAALVIGILVAFALPAAAQGHLTIIKVGGDGIVMSVPDARACPPNELRCGMDFPAGTIVTLTVAPLSWSQFTHWGGDADCADGTVTMSSDRRCVTYFDSGPPTPGGTDFNQDGSPDLLWRHPAGWLTAWLLNGAGLLGAESVYTGATDWRPVGTGDVDGDGHADLVWQHPQGFVTAWRLRGTAFVEAIALYTEPTDRRVFAVADMNADGQADLVMQYFLDHVAEVWLLRTGQVPEVRPYFIVEGRVVGTGDFNGDHHPDLVRQKQLGDVDVILMDGNQRPILIDGNQRPIGAQRLYWGGASDWQVRAAGDYDGDGLTDIVWQHEDGFVSVWLLEGVELREARSIYTGATEWIAFLPRTDNPPLRLLDLAPPEPSLVAADPAGVGSRPRTTKALASLSKRSRLSLVADLATRE